MPGYELVQRAPNQVTGIEVDGEMVPIDQVEFVDGKACRRPRPKQ